LTSLIGCVHVDSGDDSIFADGVRRAIFKRPVFIKERKGERRTRRKRERERGRNGEGYRGAAASCPIASLS